MDRTYYMLPHIPHAWKILERVGAMKDVMGGLVINDEVMDHFIDLEPAHISWAWMMGARTPEELKVLGKAILFAELISERDSKYKDQHYPRADPKYVKELADLIEQLKDEHEFVKEGHELLQKFRQEGRPFGKAVFEELEEVYGKPVNVQVLIMNDSIVVIEGDKTRVYSYGDVKLPVLIEHAERIVENGRFVGIRISGKKFSA